MFSALMYFWPRILLVPYRFGRGEVDGMFTRHVDERRPHGLDVVKENQMHAHLHGPKGLGGTWEHKTCVPYSCATFIWTVDGRRRAVDLHVFW